LRRTSPSVLIHVFAAFVFLASVGTAHAHLGHFADLSVAHRESVARLAHDVHHLTTALPHRLELHAPGCPADGSGNCCCTPDAHVPLSSSHFALPVATTRLATLALAERPVFDVPATAIARPIVIGSRGSRGPPLPSSFR
jgi:hypothetical protein